MSETTVNVLILVIWLVAATIVFVTWQLIKLHLERKHSVGKKLLRYLFESIVFPQVDALVAKWHPIGEFDDKAWTKIKSDIEALLNKIDPPPTPAP